MGRSKENGKYSNEQLAKASKNLNFRLNDLKQYINEASDKNFFLKVTADLKNGVIAQDSIKILAENVDSYIPMEKMFPKSPEGMEQDGACDMQSVIEEQESEYSPSVCPDYVPSYARQYSSIYTSNPSGCYDHGSSCGTKQARDKWNNYWYNYYSELCHNDCADFVSQALSYGELPEDSTWYATKFSTTRSYAWVNTGALKSHMLNNGYWVSTSFSSATEGAVMYTASDHVVMIARNDTVSRQYNGHTNDRYITTFSDSSSFQYYKLW